ncbi:olfactory receptor 142-like [Oryzias melastigma]|uniref:olfactory receptor 142-like n=1 Tax=Oryzias melastigma TaxID=30732 RepID=UPI00168D4AC3|nr:olfactory receptor 142-like [Oryzias melastigma]
MNSSQVGVFSLTAYLDWGRLRFLLFLLVLGVYALIVFCNLLLIVVICVSRSLHEPMFLFLCSLFVNELLGSSGLFPFLLLQILADVHRVSAPLCFLQVFVVHSYGAVELLNLAVMAFDRYLAICCPLQYHAHMTPRRVLLLLGWTWTLPVLFMLVSLSLLVPLRLCRRDIHKVYCDMHSVVKLACSDTAAVNAYGLVATFSTIVGALLFILYSYGRILRVCCSGSRQTRQKAVSTCSPHLASVLNFAVAGSFEVSQSRFNMAHTPDVLRVFLSVYFLSAVPLFNPLMYGLKMSQIRNACRSLMSRRTERRLHHKQ